jgi:hypothetical protein
LKGVLSYANRNDCYVADKGIFPLRNRRKQGDELETLHPHSIHGGIKVTPEISSTIAQMQICADAGYSLALKQAFIASDMAALPEN